MSFPRYPDYRESGVDWLGRIPRTWKLTSLKHGYTVTLGKMLQPDQRTSTDKLVPYLRAANIQPNGVDIGDVRKMWMSPLDIKNLCLESGDLLVSEGGDVGRSAVWDYDEKMYIQNSVNRVRALNSNSTKFLFYWITALKAKGFIDVLCNKSTIAHFTAEKVAAVPTPFPDTTEKHSIARFLAHETAKIDTLIHEQKRLIELLKEKRQAVISHAVTKGLDPDVPMKDSGVEWLGEVPAHWQLSKFGYLSNVVRGGSPRPAGDPSLFNGDYMPWVTVAEITKDESVFLDKTETSLTRLGSAQCRVFKAGTLLISNSGATLGVPKVLNIDANANDGVVGFESLNKTLCIKFAYHYLASLTENLRERIRQGSGQPNLNTEIIRGIVIPLPSPKEQKAIIDFIDAKSSKYSELCREGAATVRTLEERRSALISAAVTGKIDVRDWQPPADESAFDEQVRQAEMEAEA